MLSFMIMLTGHFQPTKRGLLNRNQQGMHTLITYGDYEVAFLTLLREAQMYLMPKIFIELENLKFSTSLANFKGIVLFLDKFGLVRTMNPFSS